MEEGSESRRAVLDRIRKGAVSLGESVPVEYGRLEDLKREYRLCVEGSKASEPTEKKARGPGRPKVDESLKTRDVRVSLKAELFRELEQRKRATGTRSKLLCDLLEKGLKYEELRLRQACVLKEYLGEFAKAFSRLKVRRGSASWRTSRIDLGENEIVLAKLYAKSLEIRRYLEMADIDLGTFSEIKEFFSPKELKRLEFASVPERIGRVVSPSKEVSQ